MEEKIEEADRTMSEIFIARQPIVDRNGHIFAYELLFRTGMHPNVASVECNKTATTRVLINTLNNFGSKMLLGDRLGFVNVDHTILSDTILETVPPGQFVFELLESTVIDETTIARVRSLWERGLTFAIDDMDLSETMLERFAPVLPYITYVKIDLLLAARDRVHAKTDYFASFPHLKFLAEKVESHDDFMLCKQMGFDYFQGYFYAKPMTLSRKKIDPSFRTLLELNTLLDNDADIDALERTLVACPYLLLNLLRFINSSAISTTQQVTSIRQAIMLLGRTTLRQWILLFLYAQAATDNIFTGPIMELSLLRGQIMRHLCHAACDERLTDKAFMIGILSMFDALLQAPLDEILGEVSLHPAVTKALLYRDGPMGRLLELAVLAGQHRYDDATPYLSELQLSHDDLLGIVQQSSDWVSRSLPTTAA